MIEADSTTYTDRLNAELDVVARIRPPVDAAELDRLFAEHAPGKVLRTGGLDSCDDWFLATCRARGVELCLLADPAYGSLVLRGLRRYGGLPWVRVVRKPRWRNSSAAQRTVDLMLIALSSPIWLPLMIVITVVLGRAPLYVQERVGAGGRTFRMVKFRTMVVDAERDAGPALCGAHDPRVTPLGRILRRTRLDELPQIWNILRGEMSIVGPRPERPEFADEMRRLRNYQLRELMRPGLTGIAQLVGGYDASAEEKLRCDLLYLHSRSLRCDLKLIALTVVELIRGFPRG